jgi:uncharacterized SAM-dependent methyltransferase
MIGNSSNEILIHPSRFAPVLEKALLSSLRVREMDHQFHYDSPRKAARWLRLHQAFSPACTDPDCERLYETAFTQGVAPRLLGAHAVEVVSLGCGGGQKDARLLASIRRLKSSAPLHYLPTDASIPLAFTARDAAKAVGVPAEAIAPVALDLAGCADWLSALAPVLEKGASRIVCFFGMLPNFVPCHVLPQLAALLGPGDLLLASANYAPGKDYDAGVARILPLYDNHLTRDWLWTVMTDLGVRRQDARMRFCIQPCPQGSGLLRIEARLHFRRACRIEHANEAFEYVPGEEFRLFFSYRHTPERLATLLKPLGLSMQGEWRNASGEEGVFLCTREGG